MARLFAPNGCLIVGTKERILGVAGIAFEDVTRGPDGKFTYEYSGGTEVDWDSSETVEEDGQTIFVDDDGTEWPEDSLTLREDAEEEDEE